MTSHPVECLRCGAPHLLVRVPGSRLDLGDCPHCGYVGWAPVHRSRARALLGRSSSRQLRLV